MSILFGKLKKRPLIIKKFKCHVFLDSKNKSKYPGANCFVYLFDDYNHYVDFHKNYDVCDEFDHCFLNIKKNNNVELIAKNKNGYIEFCGSASYAACNILLNEFELKDLNIKLEKKLLRTFFENNEVVLEFDNQPHHFIFEEDYFFDEKSGIYFKELKDKNELVNDQLLKNIISKWEKSRITIHGACFFYYDNLGLVRYFVPWHGRDEDYITGSIHQYLTPYISKSKNINDQTWHQLSSSPGILFSKIKNDKIQIKGEVFYE